MGEDITVRGGPGGVTADLTDMRRVADELDRAGDELRRVAAAARRLTGDADLLASAVLSPGTAARATAQLLDAAYGPTGTTAVAATLELGAVGLRGIAELFETRDEAAAGLTDARERLGGAVLGRVAIPAGLGAYLLHLGEETGDASWDVATGLLTGRMGIDEAVARLRATPGDAGADLAEDLHHLLISHPELVDHATGGATELTRGLLGTFPLVGDLVGAALPQDYEDLTALLLATGQRAGLFVDGPVTIGGSREAGDIRLESLADLMVSQELVMDATRDDPDGSLIRVVEVGTADAPAWVVQIPGTQEWPARAGRDPSDLTTNLALEAHHDAAILDAVADAMRRSGVSPDDPVLLSGHSQGGIAAVSFAGHADHGSAFNVTHVVTAGSPVGRIPIPDGVKLLALEHVEDPVPRLEGDPNPDRPNVTTVTRSVATDARAADNVVRAHGIDLYAATAGAVDDSADPGLRHFLDGSRHFLDGAGRATDHEAQRAQ